MKQKKEKYINTRTKCVIEANVMNCLFDLCIYDETEESPFKNVHTPNSYQIRCLSLFIEALVLYDEIVVFSYQPYPWCHPTFEESLINPINNIEPNAITFYNAYHDFSNKKIREYSACVHSVRFKDGSVVGAGFLQCPEDIINNNIFQINSLGMEPIKNSLKSFGAEEYINNVHINDIKKFIQYYSGNRIWQIEMTRKVASEVRANGVIYSPMAAPYWSAEHKFIKSYLQRNFNEFENAIKNTHLGDHAELDLSPLTAILLNSVHTPNMIPEAMYLLRRDYQELRTIGSKYEYLLQSAKSYDEISEVVNQWKDAWQLIIKEIGKSKTPLIRKLFGWDILKEGSLKGIFINSLEKISKSLKELKTKKILTILHELENEFLYSEPIVKRLNDLYGKENFYNNP